MQCGDKVWKKKEATYREAEVHVYDERGLLVPVDDLAEAVHVRSYGTGASATSSTKK